MDIKNIKEYWSENLYTFDNKSQYMNMLDRKSHEFLCTVGIPIFQESHRCYKYLYTLEKTLYREKSYIRIANSVYDNVELCIDTQTGAVIHLDKECDEYTCYVNKDIETYIKCITYEYSLTHNYSQMKDYPKYTCPYVKGVKEKEFFDYACKLYNCINKMDEKAVEMKSVWNPWVAFLMEMADGECDYHTEEITCLIKSGKYKSYEETIYAFIAGKEKFND
ncbi:MAG: hypothetical protein J1F11_06780 [Oscillospiraceae bacterium]|nr:hypothetical protein [Oscillospiraceae bacterium]